MNTAQFLNDASSISSENQHQTPQKMPEEAKFNFSTTFRQEELGFALINCRLPDYLVAAMKRHLPHVESADSAISYANNFNFLQKNSVEIILKAKQECEDFHRVLLGEEMLRDGYVKMKAEKEAAELRARNYAEALASCNVELHGYQEKVKELEGFVQQYRDSVDRLDQEKNQLSAEKSCLESALSEINNLKTKFEEQSTRVRELEQQVSSNLKESDLEQVKSALIGSELPDYLVEAINHHLPALEVIYSVISCSRELNFREANLREIIVRTKEERDNLRDNCDKLKVEREAANLRAEHFETNSRKLEGFSQRHLNIMNRLGREKEQLLAENNTAEQKVQEISAENGALKSALKKVNELNVKVTDLRVQLEMSKKKNANLEAALEDSYSLKVKFGEQSKRIEELETQISTKTKEFDLLKEATSIKIQGLEANLCSKAEQIAGLAREVEEKEGQINKLIYRDLSMPVENLERAILIPSTVANKKRKISLVSDRWDEPSPSASVTDRICAFGGEDATVQPLKEFTCMTEHEQAIKQLETWVANDEAAEPFWSPPPI